MGEKADQTKGKLKEAAGVATDDDKLVSEGRRDQMKGDVKQAGKKLKDAAKKL